MIMCNDAELFIQVHKIIVYGITFLAKHSQCPIARRNKQSYRKMEDLVATPLGHN